MAARLRARFTLRVRVTVVALVLALISFASFLVGQAMAVNGFCNVNASGGYANCLSVANPVTETVKAQHTAGLAYKMELWRPADGAIWGPWTFGDLNFHVIGLSAGGSITEQVDNQGTANPASYYCEMI